MLLVLQSRQLKLSFLGLCALSLLSSGAPFPISFGIPESKIVAQVPAKELAFAKLIPGKSYTYTYRHEADYYQGYQQAFFGFTWKKGGWDCMRHYEILANGCIPYFRRLDDCPTQTMFRLPRALIKQAMNLPGVSDGRIDFSRFDQGAYLLLAEQLLAYTRQHLTTRSIAKYVLEQLHYSGNGKILFLTQNQVTDYLKACVLIGLKEELAARVIDYPKLEHIYQNFTGNVAKCYGRGFSYTKIVADDPVDRSDLETRIKQREFELIIYGYPHVGRDFYELVSQYYPAEKIAYLCGEDIVTPNGIHVCEFAHLPNCFLRESTAYQIS